MNVLFITAITVLTIVCLIFADKLNKLQKEVKSAHDRIDIYRKRFTDLNMAIINLQHEFDEREVINAKKFNKILHLEDMTSDILHIINKQTQNVQRKQIQIKNQVRRLCN